MESPSTLEVLRGALASDSPARTRAIGRALGASARPGSVIALSGELGAGKTLLTKGVAEGLGVTGVVNSPTFVLMNEHEGRLRLHHIDAYRLADPEEAVDAGLLDDREVAGVTVIEWADRLGGWLPAERLDLHLAAGVQPTDRTIDWVAIGDSHARLASEALDGR
jgi:tRNA threonylcarbamoyladenosine biosynthesis protein TsaE